MRVILTLMASSLLVTAAWAAARYQEPAASAEPGGTGGSGVARSIYEPFADEMRGATGSTVGHTHAATGSGMTGTGSTSTGGGL